MFFSPFLRLLFFGILLPGAVMLPSLQALGSPADDATRALALELQNRYGSLTSLTFTFDQVTRTGARERTAGGKATFYRYRPVVEEKGEADAPLPEVRNIMRWDYTEPDTQIILSDGETLSIYSAKDRQLIRSPASELESDITYAFFAGKRGLLDDFEPRPPDDTIVVSHGEKLRALLLVPKTPHNQIRDVQLWVDDAGLIRHLLIRDHFDSVTELDFTDVRTDTLPPGDRRTMEELTSFFMPPGTEIISR
ncbi:MAG: hypothetical protein Kow0089_15080 [Desulfobulbaceae bacterium]